MQELLNISIEIRLAVIFAVGCCLGSICNLAIYRLAYRSRAISPWSRPPKDAPPRRASDRLPIIGWLGLRREQPLHGPNFWIRPVLVELGAGALLAGLYWWEVVQLGLLPLGLQNHLHRVPQALALALPALHAEFLAHALLCLLMLVASLIDIDETTIPDGVTIPGTLLGLALAVALPSMHLPEMQVLPSPPPGPTLVHFRTHSLASPLEWPDALAGAPHRESLILGIGCFGLWCFGLLPRRWMGRHGWRRAAGLLISRLARERFTIWISALAFLGSVAILLVWGVAGSRWQSLLTSLVGLAVGGGLIWTVRILGRFALRKEAMGFGDVTLMAMIGVFMGWQASLAIFFLAPFAGILLGIAQWISGRGNEIPYGPFLCLATLATLVFWADLWEWMRPFFELPWLVPSAMLFCLAVLTLLLSMWRWIAARS